MLKFLLYMFVFYVVFRLIFGRFLGGNNIKAKVYRYETHHHHYNERKKPEGSVTIDPKTVKPHKDDKSLGEYVDFEEVK